MNISSKNLIKRPIKEMDTNYTYKTNKNGTIYRGQLEKYKLVDTLTDFKVPNNIIINIKQLMMKFVNEQKYIQQCIERSKFLNRHLNDIIISLSSAKCVYEYLFDKKDWSTTQNNIRDFLLYLFNIDYSFEDNDETIKIENIYDNIEISEVEIFVDELTSIISSYLIEIKYRD